MGCCGWRGGSDKDKLIGVYGMSAFTATAIDRMLTDKERMERFHKIRDFLAGRFASLSLYIFQSNIVIGLITNVPSFDKLEWQDTPNGQVLALNLIVSCDGFANRMHVDKDHTQYAFGLFGLINRQTGQPCDVKDAASLGSVEGLYFVVKRFGIKVALSQCNGVSEVLWDSKIPHYTSASELYDAEGNIIEADVCKVTQFGSSCQISETLVNRISILEKEKATLSPQAWEKFKSERVKTYENENRLKTDRFDLKEKLRAEILREKRATRVKKMIESDTWVKQ